MGDIGITFAIVAAVIALFLWDRFPVVLVALGTALALYATGVLDSRQAASRASSGPTTSSRSGRRTRSMP